MIRQNEYRSRCELQEFKAERFELLPIGPMDDLSLLLALGGDALNIGFCLRSRILLVGG